MLAKAIKEGGKDQVVGGEASKIIAEQIVRSKLIIYPNLGHGAYKEGKQFEINLLGFLKAEKL